MTTVHQKKHTQFAFFYQTSQKSLSFIIFFLCIDNSRPQFKVRERQRIAIDKPRPEERERERDTSSENIWSCSFPSETARASRRHPIGIPFILTGSPSSHTPRTFNNRDRHSFSELLTSQTFISDSTRLFPARTQAKKKTRPSVCVCVLQKLAAEACYKNSD